MSHDRKIPLPAVSTGTEDTENGMAKPVYSPASGRIENQAKRVLNGAGSPRFTLCLGLILTVTLTVGLCVMVECLGMACYMLNGTAAFVATCVYRLAWVGVLLFVGVPLLTAVYRMAVLISQRAHGTQETGGQTKAVSLTECLYPFTSPGAYGRTLRVGMEAAGWIGLMVLAPIGVYAAWCRLVVYAALSPSVGGLIKLCGGILCIGLFFLLLWCSGRRAGYGWLVFTNPHMSLSDMRFCFRGFHRSRGSVMRLRLRMTGWFMLSVLSVGVLCLVHTVPYWMLCGAEYARELACLSARCEAGGRLEHMSYSNGEVKNGG